MRLPIRRDQVLLTGVAVEKLFLAEKAKMKLRQDALWAFFSDPRTFSIPQFRRFGGKSGFFNSHRR
jgi:hypothetical protein